MNNKRKCCVAIALALAIKKKETPRKKRVWMNELLRKRDELMHEKIINELKLGSLSDFHNLLAMDEDTYNELLILVKPKIERADTHMRKAISVNQRLSITLQFLATGNSYGDLKFISAISRQAIGKIVIETCEAIIEVLKHYMQIPTGDEAWKSVAEEFYRRCDFPNCVGAVDGKLVSIKKPTGPGSCVYNSKKFFGIILMAVVSANYEFLMVDVGINGRISDGGVLSYTVFERLLADESLNLPEPNILPSSNKKLPYIFVGDDAFQLTQHLMKPYGCKNLTDQQRIFNYRLNHVRYIAENTLSILASRFRVLQRTIWLTPDKAQRIVLACCYLHNYLRKKIGFRYISSSHAAHTEISLEPSWKDQLNIHALQQNQRPSSTKNGQDIRDKFCNYFNNEGKVSWQNNFVNGINMKMKTKYTS